MALLRALGLFLTHNSGNDYMALPKKIYRKVEKVKKEGKKCPEALNCQQKMAKTAQVLSNLNENFFDFVVKQFCGSSVGPTRGGKQQTGAYEEPAGGGRCGVSPQERVAEDPRSGAGVRGRQRSCRDFPHSCTIPNYRKLPECK
jgi:hypothetical protein